MSRPKYLIDLHVLGQLVKNTAIEVCWLRCLLLSFDFYLHEKPPLQQLLQSLGTCGECFCTWKTTGQYWKCNCHWLSLIIKNSCLTIMKMTSTISSTRPLSSTRHLSIYQYHQLNFIAVFFLEEKQTCKETSRNACPCKWQIYMFEWVMLKIGDIVDRLGFGV